MTGDITGDKRGESGGNAGECGGLAAESMSDKPTWAEWRDKFVAQMEARVTGIPKPIAVQCAEAARDAYNDGEDPIDMANEELSYWGD